MSRKLFIDFNAISWKYINWSIIRCYVSRLQRRIYKAAFRQEHMKMRQLQKKLLFSPHSKLLSVFTVVQQNTTAQLKYCVITNNDKLIIAKHLKIGQEANYILTNFVREGIKTSYRSLLNVLIEQAKQFLAELAIKPEWTAKSTRNLYRFTINDYSKKKLIKLARNLHESRNIYTLTLDLAMYVIYGNYLGVVDKLSKSGFLFLRNEMVKWLEKENLVAFKARVISYENLSSYVAVKRNSLPIKIIISLLISEMFNWLVRKKMCLSVKCFIHNSQLVLLCDSLLVQQCLVSFIKRWFIAVKTDMRLIHIGLGSVQDGFKFIGFHIQRRCGNTVFSVSKKSRLLLWKKLNIIIQKSKGISPYQLIQRLSPTIAFWGNYFKYAQCLKTFSYLDYLLHLKIWVWVLRYNSASGKNKAKQRCFPNHKQCIYNRRLVKSTWLLYGCNKTKKIRENFLVRFLWFKYLGS